MVNRNTLSLISSLVSLAMPDVDGRECVLAQTDGPGTGFRLTLSLDELPSI